MIEVNTEALNSTDKSDALSEVARLLYEVAHDVKATPLTPNKPLIIKQARYEVGDKVRVQGVRWNKKYNCLMEIIEVVPCYPAGVEYRLKADNGCTSWSSDKIKGKVIE